MGIDLESYNTVPERIAEFREKYPNGSLQQVSYELLEASGKTFLAFTAAAYREPDDPKPGIGTAWEPVPGPTQFTRDSEMQNAETAAWGRAIVAALAADTRKGVASREEVRNRTVKSKSDADIARDELLEATESLGWTGQKLRNRFYDDYGSDLVAAEAGVVRGFKTAIVAESEAQVAEENQDAETEKVS